MTKNKEVKTMRRLSARAAALVASLLLGVAAHAVPVLYDFVGTGTVCEYHATNQCVTEYQGEFTGVISIDVLTPLPTGPDSIVTSNYAWGYDWVISDFLIEWAGNSFNPEPIPNQTSGMQHASVAYNGEGLAGALENREQYQYAHADGYHSRYAILSRTSNSGLWLTEFGFQHVGLADGSNTLNFADYQWVTATNTVEGFIGSMVLTELTIRPTAVPEPATLSLFGLGFAGLAFVRRRRTSMS